MTDTPAPSARKAAANRRNATRSTGPRTPAGKAVAKMNALVHGMRAEIPVVPGETAEEWEVFRAGVTASLTPVGTLEAELADRVAALAWRLRRAAAFETGVTAGRIDAASAAARGGQKPGPFDRLRGNDLPVVRTFADVQQEREAARDNAAGAADEKGGFTRLRDASDADSIKPDAAYSLLLNANGYTPNGDDEYTDITDADFLDRIGVPEEWRDDLKLWDGWTVGIVRAGVALIAEDVGMTRDELIERAIRGADQRATADGRRAARLDAELAGLATATAAKEAAARREALVPDEKTANRVMRYEGHLARQLTQTLHLLERLRAARSENPPPPPAALDVTVHGAEGVGDGVGLLGSD